MRIIIGSRGSKLALCQAGWVKDRLAQTGHEAEVKIIKTTGDKLANVPLARSGVKGVFIKEIEEALLAGAVDIAVHSLKDLPAEQPQGLSVAAVPEREDARDVLISRSGAPLDDLPPQARVGTGSLRRESQLRALRGGLEIISIRGNIDTRLKKLDGGQCDALVLAAAGLRRLGLEARITRYFEADEICPAVGQGALAIESREGDARIASAVAPLDHEATHQAVRAERATLLELGGGCQTPMAAHACVDGDDLRLVAVVASLDGLRVLRGSTSGPRSAPEELGRKAAQDLIARGARDVLS